jgi:hypothetical protein
MTHLERAGLTETSDSRHYRLKYNFDINTVEQRCFAE